MSPLTNIRTIAGRPLVTVSYAQTLDGRIATSTGDSRWISGPESLRFAHELRAGHDAIMVGVGTVLKDDPQLTVRLVPGRNPLRVVVDSSLRTPLTAAVLAGGAGPGTVLVVTDSALPDRCESARGLGAEVLCLPSDVEGRVDLNALLAGLKKRGIESVMVEGGSELITSLLRLHMVDRLAVCVAPRILGAGIEAVGDLGIRELAKSLTLENVVVTTFGNDVVIDGRVVYPGGSDER